ncbi:unnamed protein product [Cunninghamella echinulata]
MNVSELCVTSTETTYSSTSSKNTKTVDSFNDTKSSVVLPPLSQYHHHHQQSLSSSPSSTLPRFSIISSPSSSIRTNNYNNELENKNNDHSMSSSTSSSPFLSRPPFSSYHMSPIEKTNSFSKLAAALPKTPPLTDVQDDDDEENQFQNNNNNNNNNNNKLMEINKLVEKCNMLCKDLSRYKVWKKGSEEDREAIFDFVSHTAQEILDSLLAMQQQEEDHHSSSLDPSPHHSSSQTTSLNNNNTNNSNSEMEYEMIRQARNWKDNRKPKYRRRNKRSMVGQRCHSCHTTETPEWRRGPDGARTLCNACGLHYSKLLRKESISASSQKLITSTAAPHSHSISQQSITTLPPSATMPTNHTIPISTTTTTSAIPSSYPFMITTHHQHLHHYHHLSPHPTPLHLLNHPTTASSPSSTSSPSLSSSSSSNFSIVHQHHPNYN